VHDLVHFTDWLPTLLAAAGIDIPRELRLDGVDVLPVLRGERGAVCDRRFWQWNRYAPVGACNAAMRDGKWKLVRPAIDALLQVTNDDLAIDIDAKFNPERHTAIRSPAPPEWEIPPLAPAQLFDLERDPGEAHDLAALHPERTARMERELAAWFEDVERERLLIRA
jgi:arylsulfatase A